MIPDQLKSFRNDLPAWSAVDGSWDKADGCFAKQFAFRVVGLQVAICFNCGRIGFCPRASRRYTGQNVSIGCDGQRV